jgi:recombinational DNA repair protein (RecF pathway)
MSSRQYITKAIVCGSRHTMTSDKSYLLFTQELGMLWAVARSVRMEKSKQRCALQDFSIIRVSLVQGRSVWRIGSVEALSNPFFESSSRIARGGVSYIIKMLRKYIHGDGMTMQIFIDTQDILKILLSEKDIDLVTLYQQVFLLRLFNELGYIKKTENIQKLIEESSIIKVIESCKGDLPADVKASIAHAQEVSHL